MMKLVLFSVYVIAILIHAYAGQKLSENGSATEIDKWSTDQNSLIYNLMEDVYLLRKDYGGLRRSLAFVKKKLVALESTYTEDKSRVRTVGFSAQLKRAQTTHETCPSTIVFEHIQTNAGGGYNAETGIFTAPRTGYYSLSVSLTTAIGSDVFIMLNGQSVQFLYYASTGWNGNSATVNLHLHANDKVWVSGKGTFFGYMYDGFPCDTIAAYGLEYSCFMSTFSGFLISTKQISL